MKMLRKILFKLGKQLIKLGFNWLYNYIDKNNDNKLSKEEIKAFAYEMTKRFNKLKNKAL